MLLASNTHYMRYGRGSFAVEDSLFKYRTWEQNTKKLNMEKYMARFYNDQAFAPFIMLFEMTNELSLDELKELRGQLNEKLNNHPYTKELDEIIASTRALKERQASGETAEALATIPPAEKCTT